MNWNEPTCSNEAPLKDEFESSFSETEYKLCCEICRYVCYQLSGLIHFGPFIASKQTHKNVFTTNFMHNFW